VFSGVLPHTVQEAEVEPQSVGIVVVLHVDPQIQPALRDDFRERRNDKY
jgi:hypothetical protein